MTTSNPTGYTNDEISAVVDQLIQTTVARPYDTLGIRRTDVTFSDLQTAAANMLILYPAAPFYVVKLGSSRLLDLVYSCESDILALLASLRVLRKRTLPVRDISSLADANAALGALSSAVGSRTKGTNVANIPAYVRFNTSVTRFLSQVGGNVKDPVLGIVPTPQEATGNIPGQLTSVQGDLTELVRRAGLIKGAIADYGSLDLPDLVAENAINNARALLQSQYDTLAGLSENDRLTVLRSTVLNVLAAQAVVSGVGIFGEPTGINPLSGSGSAYADATRPSNGATITAPNLGPYQLYMGSTEALSNNVLYLYADAAPPYPAAPTQKLFLPPSVYARVEGLVADPYVITAGVNDQIVIGVNGIDYTINLAVGTAVTAATICANISGVLAGAGFQAIPVFNQIRFDGKVNTSALNVLTLPAGYFPAGSVIIGDQVDFYYGTNSGTTRNVTAIGTLGGNIVSITVDGLPLTPATDDQIQYGDSSRRFRILPINIPASLAAQDYLEVVLTTSVQIQAGATLGLFNNIKAGTTYTDASTIVTAINKSTNNTIASLNFESSVGPLLARTLPGLPTTFIVYFASAMATWTGGLSIQILLSSALTDSRIVVGSTAVLRGGQNPDVVGIISAISSDGLTYNVGFSIPIPANTNPNLVDFMPAFPFVEAGQVLVISTGVNAGRYYVQTPDPAIPGQFKARLAAPVSASQFNEPTYMTGDFGSESFSLTSVSKTLASAIGVYDQHSTFWTTPSPATVHATTNYFKLPSLPPALVEGDILEEYISNYEVPDVSANITNIDSDGVLELDTPVAYNLSLYFGETAIPYGILRAALVNNFNTYAALLVGWLANFPLSTSTFFDNINAVVNPLLKNTNPTDYDIGVAEDAINNIYQYITIAGAKATGGDPALSLEGIIQSYTAQHVPQIDTMVTTYTQKGADRAMDLFLTPEFSTFFGLSQAESSYAGAFQQAAQAVAVNDLVVLKSNRVITSKSQLTGTSGSPDYETDQSDLDTSPIIDPPADIDRTQ